MAKYLLDPYWGVPRREIVRVARLVREEIRRVFGFVPLATRDREGNYQWEMNAKHGRPRLTMEQLFHGPFGAKVSPTGRLKMYLGYPYNSSYITPKKQPLSQKTIAEAVKAAKAIYDDYRGTPPEKVHRNPHRGVRRNSGWLELGTRIMKIAQLHPTIQNVAKGAMKRGLKWYAYRVSSNDKYRHREPYGQWLWIPKANLIGHVQVAPPGSGGFLTGEGRKTVPFVIRWRRPHPLARDVKEVWHADHWGSSTRGKLDRFAGDVANHPQYEHWLEAREAARREGRSVAPFDKWTDEKSDAFHETWLRRSLTARTRYDSFRSGIGKNPRRGGGLSTPEMLAAIKRHSDKTGEALDVSLLYMGHRNPFRLGDDGGGKFWLMSYQDSTSEVISRATMLKRYAKARWFVKEGQTVAQNGPKQSSSTVLAMKGLRRRLWGIKNLAISTLVVGWDTIIDRTEQAILRSGIKDMFKGELREIAGLRRRYKGHKMPLTTAISPASGALWKLDKALGKRR